jgi:hypothetical protein
VESLMDTVIVVRSVAFVALAIGFPLMLTLGCVLAIDEMKTWAATSVPNMARKIEEVRIQRVLEQQVEAVKEQEFWADFKRASGFNDTGEIVNKYHHNWKEESHGPGRHR